MLVTRLSKKYQLLVTSQIIRPIFHETGSWLLFFILLSILLFVCSSIGYGFMLLLFLISLILFIWHKWESTTSRKIDKLTKKADWYYARAIEEIGYALYEVKKDEQDNTDFLVHIVKMTNLRRKLRIMYEEDEKQLYTIAANWYRYCESIWKRDAFETMREIELKFKHSMILP